MKLEIRSHYAGQDFRVAVVPDQIFALDFTAETNEPPAFFVLEADRGMLTIEPGTPSGLVHGKSFLKKLLGYHALWQQWHPDSPRRREPDFGYAHFRVLTVTTSRERVANMIRATEKATKGKGARLFLFTDRESFFSSRARVGELRVEWQEERRRMRERGIGPEDGEWRVTRSRVDAAICRARAGLLGQEWINGRGEHVRLTD